MHYDAVLNPKEQQSRKNRKRAYVFRADDSEVPSIQRGDDIEAKSLGKRHNGRVDGAEGQIAISRDELGDPHPIAWENRCRSEVSS